MRYRPSPKCLIAQYVKPVETKGFLIIPEVDRDTRMFRVIRTPSEDCPYKKDELIMVGKYHIELIDSDEALYSINIEQVICVVEEE
jgi:hypothetical protein